MDVCECRTMAIGRCSECQAPICMHHSRMLDGAVRCLAHHEQAMDRKRGPQPPPVTSEPRDEAPPRPERRGWGRRR